MELVAPVPRVSSDVLGLWPVPQGINQSLSDQMPPAVISSDSADVNSTRLWVYSLGCAGLTTNRPLDRARLSVLKAHTSLQRKGSAIGREPLAGRFRAHAGGGREGAVCEQSCRGAAPSDLHIVGAMWLINAS